MSSEAFIKEAEIMHKLHHPKLVQLMGVCTQDPDNLLIVTELMCNGSLKDYLLKHAEQKNNLPFPSLFDIIVQVCTHFSACHFL